MGLETSFSLEYFKELPSGWRYYLASTFSCMGQKHHDHRLQWLMGCHTEEGFPLFRMGCDIEGIWVAVWGWTRGQHFIELRYRETVLQRVLDLPATQGQVEAQWQRWLANQPGPRGLYQMVNLRSFQLGDMNYGKFLVQYRPSWQRLSSRAWMLPERKQFIHFSKHLWIYTNHTFSLPTNRNSSF